MVSHYEMPRSQERIESFIEWAEQAAGNAFAEKREEPTMTTVREGNGSVGKLNYFFTDHNGYKGHVELTPAMTMDEMRSLWEFASTWSDWMVQNNWQHDGGPSNSRGGSAPTTAPKAAPAAPKYGDVRCNQCGGPTWNNTESKKNPKAPDFKCRDKDCDDAGWIQKDGKIRWASQQ